MNTANTEKCHPDADIIDALGGPAKVAERMGIRADPGATQRVWNWTKRGIPPAVRLEFPELFGRGAANGQARAAAEPTLPNQETA